MDRQHVIVVWDKNGKFFQVWTADYASGDGIAHGIKIAEQLGGTYEIVAPRSFVSEELLHQWEERAHQEADRLVQTLDEKITDEDWKEILSPLIGSHGRIGGPAGDTFL